jgi:hypothetical protein
MLDGSLYQSRTNAATLMRAPDRHLGDVELSIQLMRCEETDRLVPFVHGNPHCPSLTKSLKDGWVHRPAVGQPSQTDAPEHRCRRTLDGTEFVQIVRPSETDGDRGSAHSTVTDFARLRG